MSDKSSWTCAHCGRVTRDYKGGWAAVNGQPVCHPNEEDRPDCYRLVTVYGEELGSRWEISMDTSFIEVLEQGDNRGLLIAALRQAGGRIDFNDLKEFGNALHGKGRRAKIYIETNFEEGIVTLLLSEEPS